MMAEPRIWITNEAGETISAIELGPNVNEVLTGYMELPSGYRKVGKRVEWRFKNPDTGEYITNPDGISETVDKSGGDASLSSSTLTITTYNRDVHVIVEAYLRVYSESDMSDLRVISTTCDLTVLRPRNTVTLISGADDVLLYAKDSAGRIVQEGTSLNLEIPDNARFTSSGVFEDDNGSETYSTLYTIIHSEVQADSYRVDGWYKVVDGKIDPLDAVTPEATIIYTDCSFGLKLTPHYATKSIKLAKGGVVGRTGGSTTDLAELVNVKIKGNYVRSGDDSPRYDDIIMEFGREYPLEVDYFDARETKYNDNRITLTVEPLPDTGVALDRFEFSFPDGDRETKNYTSTLNSIQYDLMEREIVYLWLYTDGLTRYSVDFSIENSLGALSTYRQVFVEGTTWALNPDNPRELIFTYNGKEAGRVRVTRVADGCEFKSWSPASGTVTRDGLEIVAGAEKMYFPITVQVLNGYEGTGKLRRFGDTSPKTSYVVKDILEGSPIGLSNDMSALTLKSGLTTQTDVTILAEPDDGYKVGGWRYLNRGVSDGDVITEKSAIGVYFINKEDDDVKLTFISEHGTCSEDTLMVAKNSTLSVDDSDKALLISEPSSGSSSEPYRVIVSGTDREYTHTGWEYASETVTDDMDVKAEFSVWYYLYFDGNSTGTDAENVPYVPPYESTSGSQPHVFLIPDERPTLAGYTFDRWNTEPDGTGTSYNPGDEISVQPGQMRSTILYAQWISDDSVKLEKAWFDSTPVATAEVISEILVEASESVTVYFNYPSDAVSGATFETNSPGVISISTNRLSIYEWAVTITGAKIGRTVLTGEYRFNGKRYYSDLLVIVGDLIPGYWRMGNTSGEVINGLSLKVGSGQTQVVYVDKDYGVDIHTGDDPWVEPRESAPVSINVSYPLNPKNYVIVQVTGVSRGSASLKFAYTRNGNPITVMLPIDVYETHTVSFVAGTGGSISPAGSVSDVPYGSQIAVNGATISVYGHVVTATPDNGCVFDGWVYPASGTITQDTTITAKFKKEEYSIALNKSNVTLSMAGTKSYDLVVSFVPTPSDRSITWSSSDPSIVTVLASSAPQTTIHAQKAGNATITATAVNGATAKCVVTVINGEAKDVYLNRVLYVGEAVNGTFSIEGGIKLKTSPDSTVPGVIFENQ